MANSAWLGGRSRCSTPGADETGVENRLERNEEEYELELTEKTASLD